MFKFILSKPIHILGKPFFIKFLLLKYISIIDYLGISLFDISRSFFFMRALREKCPKTEFFLVRIFLYSDPFHAVRSTKK